jgi:hypothetical protein
MRERLAQVGWQGEKFMQISPHFQVGDRVQTIHPLVALPVSSSGTIYRVARVGNLYGVLFDGEARMRVMHHGYLEQVRLQERAVGEHHH